MQLAHRLFSAAAMALVSASSLATTVTYTSSTSFLSQVAVGAYTESFDGLPADPPTEFAGGGFSYTVSAPQGLYGSGEFLGTNLPDDTLTIDFTGSSVTAVGGSFYATNLSNDFQPVAITLSLSDGTVEAFTPTSLSTSYRGFTSDVTITSLVISAPGVSLYAGLDNFTVGTAVVAVPAVPEPSTWALMGLGLAGLTVARRRKR